MSKAKQTANLMQITLHFGAAPEAETPDGVKVIHISDADGILNDHKVPQFMSNFLSPLLKEGSSFSINDPRKGSNAQIDVTVTPSDIVRSTRFLELITKLRFIIEQFDPKTTRVVVSNLGNISKYLCRFLLGLNHVGGHVTFVGFPKALMQKISGLKPAYNVFIPCEVNTQVMLQKQVKELADVTNALESKPKKSVNTSKKNLSEKVIAATPKLVEAATVAHAESTALTKEVPDTADKPVKAAKKTNVKKASVAAVIVTPEGDVVAEPVKKTRKAKVKVEEPVLATKAVESEPVKEVKAKAPRKPRTTKPKEPVVASEEKLNSLTEKFAVKKTNAK